MTPEQMAAQLNGREYGREITAAEEAQARDAGLVIVFGYSDDNCELRGAIRDEVGAVNGTKIRFDSNGIPDCKCLDTSCPYFAERVAAMPGLLVVVWNDTGSPAWSYETTIPHATFDVMEDGEVYCRGIVFRVTDIPGVKP